jgi:hypothetical protein
MVFGLFIIINVFPLIRLKLNTNTNYYLLLIDIKQSTRIPAAGRKAAFGRLEQQLAELNNDPDIAPVRGLEISYGDEVAGLFRTPARLYRIIQILRKTLLPEMTFRFIVTHGKIGIVSKDIRRIGGIVFKDADTGIKKLKRQKRFCRWLIADSTTNRVLDSLTELSHEIYSRMTEYQRTVYHQLQTGSTRKKVAENLKKHPQSVSDAVKRGGAEILLDAEQTVNDLLAGIHK